MTKLEHFTKPKSFSEEQFLRLRGALTFLSAKQQLVLYLRFWEDKSIRQIANRIGLPWESTDQFIDGAINHLRVRMLNPISTSIEMEKRQSNSMVDIAA